METATDRPDLDLPELDVEPKAGPESGPSATSLLGRLKQRRREVEERQTVDLPIPGYAGELVARYRYLDAAEDISPILKRAQRFPEARRELDATADLLIAACVGVFVCDTQNGNTLYPIDPDDVGEAARYDHRLAHAFGIDADRAREILFKVFGGKTQAVISHGRQLQVWFSDTSIDVGQEFWTGEENS